MRFLAFTALAATLFTPVALAGAPSFDCAKAVSDTEKLICANADLAAADSALTGTYRALLAAHPDQAASLKESQRSFLKERAACLKTTGTACLLVRYRERQGALQAPVLVMCGQPKWTGAAFSVSCGAPNQPSPLHLTLKGTKDEYNVSLTNLSIASSGAKPQSFKLDGQTFESNLSSAIELIDVNFDGHADIKLQTATSAGPNMGYDYWLFEPKSGTFAPSKLGEQLSGFEVSTDPKAKTVSVNARGSCCDWGTTTYAWRGAALTTVKFVDTGMFSAAGIPGLDNFEHMICGTKTVTYGEGDAITRIDLELDRGKDSSCEAEDLAAQGKVRGLIERAAKDYRVEGQSPFDFAIVFAKPWKAD